MLAHCLSHLGTASQRVGFLGAALRMLPEQWGKVRAAWKQLGEDEGRGRAEPLFFCFVLTFQLPRVRILVWQRSEELETNLGDTHALTHPSSPLPFPATRRVFDRNSVYVTYYLELGNGHLSPVSWQTIVMTLVLEFLEPSALLRGSGLEGGGISKSVWAMGKLCSFPLGLLPLQFFVRLVRPFEVHPYVSSLAERG